MAVTALLLITGAPGLISAIALGATVALVMASILVPVGVERNLRTVADESAASLTSRTEATPPLAAMPAWMVKILGTEDAERYVSEWGAHLSQLVEEGELKQARKDRRQFVVAALLLAIVLRVRRLVHSH
jgi:hypothetical protein